MGTINRHYFFQLCFATFISTTILLGILLYGNVVKHDEYLLRAMAVSPYSFVKLFSLLVPYALSFALPFGFVLALLLCYGKWASSNQILALRSLGSGITSWGIPPFFLSLIVLLNYSYFNVFMGSNLAAFNAGNIDTIIVIKIELNEMIKIEEGFISDGIVLKK